MLSRTSVFLHNRTTQAIASQIRDRPITKADEVSHALDEVAAKLDDILGTSHAPRGTAVAEEGGLNLFKWNHPSSTRATGWRDGDYFLNFPNQGNPRANWAQNSSRLREVMRNNRPIFDSYIDDAGNLIPTQGFLNAERNLLINRGWKFNPSTGAWHPPTGN